MKCKPWTCLRGWQKGGFETGLKRRINRELEAKKAHKPWIREGRSPWSANRELGTFHLQNSSVSVHSLHFMVCAPLRFFGCFWSFSTVFGQLWSKWIRALIPAWPTPHFSPPKFECFSSQFALHGLRALEKSSSEGPRHHQSSGEEGPRHSLEFRWRCLLHMSEKN